MRDLEFVGEILAPRLRRAEKIYGQSLTSLWVGNAGAAIATLGFIGATWRNGVFPRMMLWPLSFFTVGLIAMGIGAVGSLIAEGRVLRQMEQAESWLQLPAGEARRPTEHAGLTLKDWRTMGALIAAVCFVAGCATGLAQLFLVN